MKVKYTLILGSLITLLTVKVNAQCTWQNKITDGFEYTTVCPDIVPGMTIHNTPQQFAVYNGNYSLYLNFVNCVGTTGCCAGDTVYKRTITMCKNMDARFSAWLTTSFSGIQCNVKIVITDGNNNVLNAQNSILAPYSPQWIQYNSGTITPTTEEINFIMITNVGGGSGNDLSMDDFVMDICYPNDTTSSTTGNICSNLSQYNLINFLPPNPDTTGFWGGPGSLTGGYLGTFNLSTSTFGTYYFTSAYYGTGAGCPLTVDSVLVDTIAPPTPNLGNDTIVCSTASVLLSPGIFPGATYLWNNGSNQSSLLANTIFVNGDTNVYWVRVTEPNGCSAVDSITVIFFNCSGIGDYDDAASIVIGPNPVADYLQITTVKKTYDKAVVTDLFGRRVKILDHNQQERVFVGDLTKGVYCITFYTNDSFATQRFLKM